MRFHQPRKELHSEQTKNGTYLSQFSLTSNYDGSGLF